MPRRIPCRTFATPSNRRIRAPAGLAHSCPGARGSFLDYLHQEAIICHVNGTYKMQSRTNMSRSRVYLDTWVLVGLISGNREERNRLEWKILKN